MSKHSLFSNGQINEIIGNVCYQSMIKPENWITLQRNFSEKLAKLITATMEKTLDADVSDLYQGSVKDRRFNGDAWKNNIYFNFIKQFYLMSSEIWTDYIEEITHNLPQGELIKFLNKQLIDGLCPSNFLFTNPNILQASYEQNGRNLIKGLDNLLHDLKKYNDFINITTNDNSNFALGQNLASTQGKVVFKNELVELLFFQTKSKVHKVPIFIVPAWINKYYILDLSPHNSFIRWLTDNNFQVFIVSWVNPDASHKNTTFDDYCMKGIIEPCNFLRKEFKIKDLNAIGYCLGGTLLSMALCYLKAKNIGLICCPY
jgi:polyhydroxyalkanoate synthase